MNNIFSWIFSHRWAMKAEALQVMLEVIARNENLTAEIIAKTMHGTQWDRYLDAQGNISDFWALEAFNYPILEGTRRVSIADGVAILPVVGPIFPRANLFTMSGGASVQSLAYDFNTALNHKDVRAIVMSYDSPGGEITGVDEFSDQIYAARNKKPVVSFIYGMAASAGYWFASAGKEIVIGETAEAGSIGVVAVYSSNKEEKKKKGIEDIEIVSSQSPNKRPDPTTDAGRTQIQTVVDDLAGVFVSKVARNRGLASADVLDKYGQGSMFVGKTAIERGLADRVGSLESIVKELQESTKPQFFFTGGIMSMTLLELQTKEPELYKQVLEAGRQTGLAEGKSATDAAVSAARKEGAEKERARIQGIEGISVPGMEKLIGEQKFNGEATVESVSALILQEQKKQREAMAGARGADGNALARAATGLGAAAPAGEAEELESAVVAIAAGFNGYNSRTAAAPKV